MPVNFQILGSSSLGNCALLKTAGSKILIDAGFSGKRIQIMLEAIGESLDQINAVFLTHEHSDHSQGIRGLSSRPDLPIFANRDTADAVQAKLTKRPNWQVFETGTTFHLRDLEIRSFALPHDACDPVGFVFRWGDAASAPRQSLAWVTDLGYVPAHVQEQMRSVETLVIEANYDEDLLEKDTKRPWSIKQRIRGRHGHLSNDAAFEALNNMNGSSLIKNVYLAHLSKDCNSLECVTQRFADLKAHKNFAIHVVDPVAL
ncbi:MAG: Putative metallo-hydrolase YycJ [Opitutia bacterium UBA7350]|nr:MAG: Putative metallo-hydrolase YycJ [Opitutae bacterium UBA7350]